MKQLSFTISEPFYRLLKKFAGQQGYQAPEEWALFLLTDAIRATKEASQDADNEGSGACAAAPLDDVNRELLSLARPKSKFLSNELIRELEQKFSAAIERLYTLPREPRRTEGARTVIDLAAWKRREARA